MKKEKENWEEEFDKKFRCFPGGIYIGYKPAQEESIKSFIRQLLEKQKEEIIKKIDEMKYSNEEIKGIGNSWVAHPAVGWNEALEKLKTQL